MALITKSDFSTYVQFTENIKDRMIGYHMTKAETLDFKPLVPLAFWTIINTGSPGMGDELETFFDEFCKPVLIHFCILRFLAEHGTNITQFGMVQPTETTSQPATDAARSVVRNQYKSDLQSYLNLFYARLKEVEYTFDGVVYDFTCEPRQNGIRIKAV